MPSPRPPHPHPASSFLALDSRPLPLDSTMPEEIYSPGLEGVIAGETAISTVAGGLSYRGYSIEDLARHGIVRRSRLSVAVWRTARCRAARRVPPTARSGVASPDADHRRDAQHSRRPPRPMDVLRSGCSLLAHWDPEPADNSHAGERSQSRAPARATPGRDGGPPSLEAGQRTGRRRELAARSPRTASTCSSAPIPRPAMSRRWMCR